MRLLKKVATILSGFALASLPAAANASIACQFNVSMVQIDWGGNLNVTLTNSGNSYWWYLCNVQGSITVSPQAGQSGTFASSSCNALFAQMLTARASGQPVQLWFLNVTACTPAALPGYAVWLSANNNFPSNIVF